MERTIPSTESEEVELYQRTYYSLLRSTANVNIRSLEEVHTGMNSLLHPGAREPKPDMSAFLYSIIRLPSIMPHIKLVVLGQNEEVFSKTDFGDVTEWQEVSALARRRRCFFNGKDTLACFIASRSDIDDVIPLLTAYQIEWNKLHHLFQRVIESQIITQFFEGTSSFSELAEVLEVPIDDFDRLYALWDEDFSNYMDLIAQSSCDISVQLLSGSLSEYRRATHAWLENIIKDAPDLYRRPTYFVSSNDHSFVNLLSGYSKVHQDTLIQFLNQPGNTGLLNEWKDIQSGKVPSSRENFLYYVTKKFQQKAEVQGLDLGQDEHFSSNGIFRVSSTRSFDIEAQIIDLSLLKSSNLDSRLQKDFDLEKLSSSNALILNINYPLGLAAYNILSDVSAHVSEILGVYVMGKAATLNAVIGDVMIPNVVHDEHTQSTFLFQNCFSANNIAPFLIHGTVFDNQKAVTVQGTFLQNAQYMDVFYREGYTDIEMEAGPYLSAVYEMYRPKRHPMNEIVNLYGLPFDLGIVHYASDTPLGRGKNLGAGSLSYYGLDSTYAVSLAILRRIFHLEMNNIQSH
jgi:hypothetical protein